MVEESDHPLPFLLLKKSGPPEKQKSGQFYLLLTKCKLFLDKQKKLPYSYTLESTVLIKKNDQWDGPLQTAI